MTEVGLGPVRLVADLDRVTLRVSRSRPVLLRAADQILAGGIPAVAYNVARTGDPLRYLYDEGVALRRLAGVLAYAYAATKDRAYLRVLATGVARNAARWPDWNPGHPLDTAQVATAVSLAYAWGRAEMSVGERDEVVQALVERMLLPYSRPEGGLARYRTAVGNQSTVVATAAVLGGLAVRHDEAATGSAAVDDGITSLSRFREADGGGLSLAGGPTVEGLMYTSYEAAHLALLHSTGRCTRDDPAVSAPLSDALVDLGVLAAWYERCGTVVEPAMGDGWDVYPWVDRTTALAALTAWPTAGDHVLELLETLQARSTLTVPGRGSWQVPDGIAELVRSQLSADPRLRPADATPPAQSFAPREGCEGSYWGCATNGRLRAYLCAVPNDAPHAHRDVGNVVVLDGDRPVLADLGQRDYAFTAEHVWRRSTRAHNTVGVLRDDGRVTQAGTGLGSVSAPDGGLLMVSSGAVPGWDWRRGVTVTASSVTVHDELARRVTARPRPLSMSFLLPTPRERVDDLGGGRLRFAPGDGPAWEMTVSGCTELSVADARPTRPYEDTPEVAAALGGSHSLVVVGLGPTDRVEVTTTVRRLAPP